MQHVQTVSQARSLEGCGSLWLMPNQNGPAKGGYKHNDYHTNAPLSRIVFLEIIRRNAGFTLHQNVSKSPICKCDATVVLYVQFTYM